MGFKLLPPKRIVGEKDWVYGIISRGRRVGTGDRVSTDAPLTLIVGTGGYEAEEDDMDYYSDPIGGAMWAQLILITTMPLEKTRRMASLTWT